MSPARLQYVLNATLLHLDVRLRDSLAVRAVAQLLERYPLAGCGYTASDGTTIVCIVGRN